MHKSTHSCITLLPKKLFGNAALSGFTEQMSNGEFENSAILCTQVHIAYNRKKKCWIPAEVYPRASGGGNDDKELQPRIQGHSVGGAIAERQERGRFSGGEGWQRSAAIASPTDWPEPHTTLPSAPHQLRQF